MSSTTPTKTQRRRPGPKVIDGGRSAIVPIRATSSWKAWLEELAGSKRMTVADLVDAAVVAFARAEGFAKAAPRR